VAAGSGLVVARFLADVAGGITEYKRMFFFFSLVLMGGKITRIR